MPDAPSIPPDVRAAIRDQAREVGRGWAGDDADPGWSLTAALFEAIADDAELLTLAAEIPLDRLPEGTTVATRNRLAEILEGQPASANW